MGESPKNTSTRISTPETPQNHTGSPTATHGANTNLDPNMQGGPITPADRAAVKDIKEQHQGQDPNQ